MVTGTYGTTVEPTLLGKSDLLINGKRNAGCLLTEDQ
jgi:hypothetical protein